MRLGLSTIAGLGNNGDSKSAVLSALFATTNRHSVLGTYSFKKDGDTTLKVDRALQGRREREPDVS